MNAEVIVIGGGVSGMAAASHLSVEGVNVTIIEKENQLGGNLANWYKLFPDKRKGSEVLDFFKKELDAGKVRLMLNSNVESVTVKADTLTVTSGASILKADAVVVASGFDLFDSSKKEEYGYGIYENVISSADLEKMFSKGKVELHNGTAPSKIGIIHCVGSRDEKAGNLYCSKLCCVTAVKQAMELKEFLQGSKVYCFYMDMRMGGAHYEELYRESQETYGINYIRGKVSEVGINFDNKLIIKVEDTLAGRPLRMELDMVVLMAGMEMSAAGALLAKVSGLKQGENRFFEPTDNHFGSNLSNIPGVFFAGTCTAPMNATESVSHARAAATEVITYLKRGKKIDG